MNRFVLDYLVVSLLPLALPPSLSPSLLYDSADVAVGWIDKQCNEGMWEDYHLTLYEQICTKLFIFF